MASNDTTVTYEMLSPTDELNIVDNTLRNVETQHYQITISRMGLTLPTQNDNGATQLANLLSQMEALQAEKARVQGLVDAAAPSS